MDNKTIGGTETGTGRAQHMEIGWFFGVESMHGRGGAKAYGHSSTARQVETT